MDKNVYEEGTLKYYSFFKDIDILPMPKDRGFLDTNDTCLLKWQVLLYLSKEG